MQSPNLHIEEELNIFRCRPDRAFYAIQLNAPWGAGKTHFIRSYLDRIPPHEKDSAGPKNLHITLFGAQTLADLERQVFVQLYSEKIRAVGTIMSSMAFGVAEFLGLDNLAKKASDAGSDILLADRLEQVRSGLVVFDDIERSRMPLKDVLGYINKFIEIEGFKVVIVVNEDAFDHANASEDDKENAKIFRAFREKLIGRTLRVFPDAESAYPIFVNSMNCIEAKNVAKTDAALYLRLFRSSERENLRSLRLGLEIFDRVAMNLDPVVRSKIEGLRDVFLSCLYVAFEHAAGLGKSSIIEPHESSMRLAMLRSTRNDRAIPESAELSKIEAETKDIIRRYDHLINLRSPVIPWYLLWSFVADGNLQIDEINRAARISPLIADPQDVPLWRHLMDIWKFDTITTQKITQNVLLKFERLEFLDPGEIMHLAGIMLWRSSMGDSTMSGGSSPYLFIQDYLTRLHNNGCSVDPNFRVFSLDHFAAYGFIVLGAPDHAPELSRIYKMVEESMQISAKAKFPETRARLIRALCAPDRDIQNVFGDDQEFALYAQMPIFSGTDPREFANFILRDNRFDHSAMKWLAERYDIPRKVNQLIPEYDWLQGLKIELESQIRNLPPPFNTFWGEIVENTLSRLLENFVFHKYDNNT